MEDDKKLDLNNDKILFTTHEQAEKLQVECEKQDKLVKGADTAVGLVGAIAAIPGPHSALFGFGAAVYQTARSNGWNIVDSSPVCDGLKAALKSNPSSVVFIEENINPSSPHKISINIHDNDEATKRVTEKLIHIGVKAEDVKTIVNEALERSNLEIAQLDQHLEQVINWQKKYDENNLSRQKEVNFQQTFSKINQFAGFMGQLGALTGSEELQQFGHIAQAGLSIVAGISGIIAATGPMAMLGPIGMIGGGALAVFSLFMKKGPDISQIILEQIQYISKQISQLGKFIGEQFEQNAKMQHFILKTMISGFEQISKQLNDQIGSLRVEQRIQLAHIQDTLDFLSRLINIYANNQYLFPFKDLCLATDKLVKEGYSESNDAKKIENIIYDLENWLISYTANEVLNGFAITEARPTRSTINDLLSEINDQKLNSILSYLDFCTYGDNFKLDISNLSSTQHIHFSNNRTNKIPNPEIHLLAIQKYIELRSEFPMLEVDSRNRRLDEIIMIGENALAFINNIEKNQEFWEQIINHYYNCLQEVYKHAHAYANSYTIEELNRLNKQYHDLPIVNQNDISFNILEPPNILINLFNGRSISKLEQDILINCSSLSNDDDKQLKKINLHNHLRNDIPKEFLTAEYLGILRFYAVPEFVQGLRIKEYAYVKTITPVGKSLPINIPLYPAGIEEEGGNPYTGPMDAYNIDATHWCMPLQVRYKLNKNNEESILVKLNYIAAWTNFISPGVGIFKGEKLPESKNKDYVVAAYCSPDEENKLLHHMGIYVRDSWNNNVIPQYGSFQDFSSIKAEIDTYFLSHREIIISNLINRNGGSGQLHIERFHQSLLELDICVKQIHLYLYLTGKSIKDSPFENLITSNAVFNDLISYQRSELDMAAPLIKLIPSSNISPFERKLNFQKIRDLTRLNLSTSHPKRLLITGQLRLEAYKVWKTLFKENFPTFSTYIDIKSYRDKCESIRSEIFRERVYSDFGDARSKAFRLSVFRINSFLDNHEYFKNHDYIKAVKSITEWALFESKNPLALEYIPDFEKRYLEVKNINGNNLSEINPLNDEFVQELTNIHLQKHGWSWNLKSLISLAEMVGQIKIPSEYELINYTIWSEGALAYLTDIVFNRKLDKIASEIKGELEYRINILDQLLSKGIKLRGIILSIAYATNLFNQLFNDYLLIFNELIKFVELRNIQLLTSYEENANKADIKDDIDIYNKLIKEPFRGIFSKYLDRLSVHGIWINSYIEMCFGFDAERLKQFIPFKNKKQMLEYLRPDSNDHYGELTLTQRLLDYRNTIIYLKTILLRRNEFAYPITNFRIFLENYIQNNWPCDTLKLDSYDLGSFGSTDNEIKFYQLIPQKIELINQFFKAYTPIIHKLDLIDINFTTASLISFLTVITRYPSFTSIQFKNCVFPSDALAILKSFLFKLPALQELSFNRSNLFFSDKSIDELSKCLKTLNSLKELDLSDNYLTDDNISKIIANLNKELKLNTLIFDGNLITRHGLLKILSLLKRNKFIKKLSFANIEPKFDKYSMALITIAVKKYSLQRLNFTNNLRDPNEFIIDPTSYLNSFQKILFEQTDIIDNKTYAIHPTKQEVEPPAKIILNSMEELGQPELDYILAQLDNAKKELLSILDNKDTLNFSIFPQQNRHSVGINKFTSNYQIHHQNHNNTGNALNFSKRRNTMFNYIENRDVNGLQKRFKEILDEYEGEDKLAHAVATKNEDGKTLTHVAIEKGYIEFINLLGEVDAPLNEKDNQKRTPLHIAVEKGSLELVQELLTWDVSLNEVNSQGKTALQLAEEKNNEGEYGKIAALLRTRQAWQEAAAGFRFNRVVHLIKQVFPAVEPAKNKDKVLFIGRTGAGKSTLLNYLNGTRYEIKVDPESAKLSAILVEGSKKEIFDVGNGMGSHTLYPQVIEKENANYVYCDLAGLFDSHGDEERICAASSVQILSRLPGQIKGIIVLLDVPGLQPAGRGEAFKRTAVALAQMIQENPALMSSVHFIITHIPKEVQNTMTSRGILNKYVIPILKSLKKTANSNKRLDTEEQALQFMLQQMVKLGERSILISNITDEGENREQIERTIENLQAHDADLYSFVSHDNAQESFNFVLSTIAQEFLERRNQIENILPKKIAEEETKQKEIEERIKELELSIKQLEDDKNKPSDDKKLDEEINKKRKRIADNKTLMSNQEKVIDDLNNDINILSVKIAQLDTNDRILVETKKPDVSHRPSVYRVEHISPYPLNRIHPKYRGIGNLNYVQEKPPLTGKKGKDEEGEFNYYEWNDDAKNGRYSGVFTASGGLTEIDVAFCAAKKHIHATEIRQFKEEKSGFKGLLDSVKYERARTQSESEALQDEILACEKEKIQGESKAELRKTRISDEIDKRNNWLKDAMLELGNSVTTQKIYEVKLDNFVLELEINQDLFQIVYNITNILDLRKENSILIFWENFERYIHETPTIPNSLIISEALSDNKLSKSISIDYSKNAKKSLSNINNNKKSIYPFYPFFDLNKDTQQFTSNNNKRDNESSSREYSEDLVKIHP